MGKGKKHPVEEYEPQTTEFNYYFNLQRTTFAPHDAVDALYFSTVFANIGVHCYELHRLWTSPYKEDNRAKFIISYMHVTTILLCLTVFFTFERTHTPYDIEVGYVSAWLWGGLILQTTSPCYIVGYFLNCFVFDSHMLMVVFINLMSLFAKAKKAGEYNVLPMYNFIILSLGIGVSAAFSTFYYLKAKKKYYNGWQGLQTFEHHQRFLSYIYYAYAAIKILQLALMLTRKNWELVFWDCVTLLILSIFWHATTSYMFGVIVTDETGNYEKLCTLIPIYSNMVLFAVNRFGDEETE